jgi:hypothetical protein
MALASAGARGAVRRLHREPCHNGPLVEPLSARAASGEAAWATVAASKRHGMEAIVIFKIQKRSGPSRQSGTRVVFVRLDLE